MAQPNQQDNSDDPSVTPIKRKRGRPRKDGCSGKDEVPESEPNKRSKRCTVLQSPSANDSLVGQEVSCSFIGVFDAGYLLTVQVGSSGPILTGMVFDPRLSVPVSAENDIAPHLPMLGRNGFAPSVEEGIINQGPGSSQAGTEQNAEFMQLIQAKESPTTSSFTSHAQTDLQLNMMEVTPSQNCDVPQTASETMEPQYIPKTTKIFIEGAATETSDQSPLASSYHPQSEAKNEHTPISAGLSDISMETPASKTSNGYDSTVLSLATSSEVSKPSNVSDASDVPEAMTLASSEPLNIPKAISTTTEASLDVSNEVLFDIFKEADFLVLKPSESSEIAQKITLTENKSTAVSGDTAFEATQVLEQQTLETRDITEGNLSSEKSSQRTEEPSEDPKVDESLGDGRSPGRSASSEHEQK
ncbi:hypothetical protein IEQ34_011163 [Dendrobium chrysotoxum]|uniref:AT-hook motif nuclear-localized protein n=1 Tax=Dendrobium chrysotoxum TaxID=161865 RepID=A0AAV7GFC5_DENCH|nr:hypothetical protein IEQ34_011163 [Dendrobium chrysotoxum]